MGVAKGRGPVGSMVTLDTFANLGLAPSLAQHIQDRLGFKAPTRIQQEAIPVVLSGKDALVKAGTGTGKTLAYLAPIVNYLQACEPRVTRANGTLEQLVRRFIWLVPGCLMGGENRAKEKARLRKGITLLVATPGRLLDHLKNTVSFQHDFLRWLIFDEADRLLDMGFQKDIQEILSVLDSRVLTSLPVRQHILLSATLNEDVNKLATLSLKEPALIFVEAQDRISTTDWKMKGLGESAILGTDSEEVGGSDSRLDYCIPLQLLQKHLLVSCRLRLIALLYLIHHKALADGTCKVKGKGCGQMTTFPGGCFRLHGNMDQKERVRSFMGFAKAAPSLLLCTDVAARGLDFQDVTCIVQYDPPGDPADYVHRVGRTARLGRAGEAVLFLQPTEADYIGELEKHGVVLEKLSIGDVFGCYDTERYKGEWSKAEMHHRAVVMHKSLAALISKQDKLNQLAVDAFRSYVRAYAVHRGELKTIFHVRNLHLGHVAKSFGLGAAPSLLGHSSNKVALKRQRNEQLQWTKKRRLELTPASE